MNEQSLRRSNWPSREEVGRPREVNMSFREGEGDPLDELHRIVTRGEVRQTAPLRSEPHFDELFVGIDPNAFEAALHREPVSIRADTTAKDPMRLREIDRAVEVKAQASAPGYSNVQQLKALEKELFESAAEVSSTQKGKPSAERPMPIKSTMQESDLAYQDPPNFSDGSTISPSPQSGSSVKRKTGPARGLGTVFVVLGLVVVGLGAAGAVSFFAWKGKKVETTEPLVVRADPRPNRVASAPTVESSTPNKVIFDRLGADTAKPQTEKIVPREESPNAALPPRPASSPAAPAAQLSEPRKVSTTTIRVRPDGSLESEPTRSTAPLAVSETARQETAHVTTLPGSPTALGGGQANPLPAAAQPGAPRTAPLAGPGVVASQPRAPAPALSPGLATPIIRETRSANPAAQTTPQPAPQLAHTDTSEASGFMVQISSQRSQEAAQTSFSDLQRRYPSLLGGRKPNIKSVDLGEKGTYYRVRLGPMNTRNEATEFCSKYKAAGGSCVVSSG